MMQKHRLKAKMSERIEFGWCCDKNIAYGSKIHMGYLIALVVVPSKYQQF